MSDLHIHTCLSPCGDLEMTPRKIIKTAIDRGLDIIAITDHNSAKNLAPIVKLGKEFNLTVIPGIEICSKEEVHLLALFDSLEPAYEMQSFIYKRLNGKNDPNIFGMQVVGNEYDEVECFEDRLLISAADLNLDEIENEIHRLNGIAIASHIDRESYSIIGQLGFIPKGICFDALEVSPAASEEKINNLKAEHPNFEFVRNSDAHFLKDIGKCRTKFFIKKPTFDEMQKAFKKIDGRKISIN